MSRQHPWPHETGNGILILILVSEILDHCQNLLDDPLISLWQIMTPPGRDHYRPQGRGWWDL